MYTSPLLCLTLLASAASGAWAALGEETPALASALTQDDECARGGDEDTRCDLSMLQVRGSKAAVERGAASADMHLEDGDNFTQTENLMTLYHQTTEAAGRSILGTGFRPGTQGVCGGAIYFSPTAKDTGVKAVGGHGFIIEAVVDMGRMLTMDANCDPYMTGAKLKAKGYDSITIDRGWVLECWFLPHCKEYIIYDAHRVKKMKGYPYSDAQSWFPGR